MLGITRHTDYAVRVVLHLACQPEGCRMPVSDIAKERRMPVPFVRSLVKPLVEAGILTSSRGSGGGVGLARPSAAISLLDVVTAMEGAIALNACLTEDAVCPWGAQCPVKGIWGETGRVLANHLASVSFAALAQNSADHRDCHVHLHEAFTCGERDA